MDIDLVFPTAIGISENILGEIERNKIINLCHTVTDKNKKNNSVWLSGRNSPANTLGNINLIEKNEFKNLLNEVDKNIKYFSSFYGDESKYICNESWVNIYKKNNFQESHSHSFPVMFNAVYFPKAPKGSGMIVFQSPFVGYSNEAMIRKSKDINYESRYYEPFDDMLIIFKANLRHYVLPGENEDERISIAFNYVLDPEEYKKNYGVKNEL